MTFWGDWVEPRTLFSAEEFSCSWPNSSPFLKGFNSTTIILSTTDESLIVSLHLGLAWMWYLSSIWTTQPTSTRRRETQREGREKRAKRLRISMWTTACTASSGRYRTFSGNPCIWPPDLIFFCSRNPAQCYQKIPWKQFSTYASDVLSTFQVHKPWLVTISNRQNMQSFKLDPTSGKSTAVGDQEAEHYFAKSVPVQ